MNVGMVEIFWKVRYPKIVHTLEKEYHPHEIPLLAFDWRYA